MTNAQRAAEIMASVRATQTEQWRREAGNLLADEMLNSQDFAMRQLCHSSPSLRKVAIEILSDHWKAHESAGFADICEELSAHDVEQRVRHSALLALGLCYEWTDDVRIAAFFARVVSDKTESEHNQMAAYIALLTVRDPIAKLRLTPSYSLKDVDWSLVRSSLDTSRAAKPKDRLVETLRISAPEAAAVRNCQAGLDAFKTGEFDESVRFFTEALVSTPRISPACLMGRGKAYIALNRLDDAIADFTRVIELHATSSSAHLERSRAYRLKGEDSLAEEDESRAAALRTPDLKPGE